MKIQPNYSCVMDRYVAGCTAAAVFAGGGGKGAEVRWSLAFIEVIMISRSGGSR